jgi:sodium transport system ATP-binding protein
MPLAMITVKNLVKDYGDFRALDDVSFSVASGEIVGLLGPNGSGKTTTQRMLAGLMEPTSGTIEIGGKKFTDDPIAARRLLGFQSGDTTLYQRLTVRETLAFFADLHEMPPTRRDQHIADLIRDFDMEAFADKKLGALSSGQKQRVGLARTILHDPAVLILDEVTASLDLLSARFVLDYLLKVKNSGTAILFSTHIMSEAELLCDRILLLHRGQILASGTKEELLAQTGTTNLSETFLFLADRREET